MSTAGRPRRWRPWVLAACVLAGGTNSAHRIAVTHAPGCAAYRPELNHHLVAHAGGGLPNRMYPNSIAALDHSYANGFRVFEMDFHQLPFGIMRAGHDPLDLLDPREAWLSQVLTWLRRHPDTRLFIDMKTDNVRGLTLIAAEAPDLRQRLTPFVYSRSQYSAVRAIGLSLPIYALFHNDDADWLTFANSHDFAGVALPPELISQLSKVRHPVIVYTYDTIRDAYADADTVITNCMIPMDTRSGEAPKP